MKAILSRLRHEDKQTLSLFHLYDGVKEVLKMCVLELPDRENKRSISRIPQGTYRCARRSSAKYGIHYHIIDVEGRSLILIHHGNYYKQTRGCLLVGKRFADINGDGYKDVVSSKSTMSRLVKIAPKEFDLTIVDL